MTRIAVLGAGRIGKIHAANAAASRHASLVAVADPFGDAARSLAEQLGCDADSNPLDAISRADVDAVIICTPTDTHVDLMLAAARAGKAVLCEKPVDLDIKRADAAVAELEALGVPVMLAFNRRFDPSSIELRRAIDAGDIGDVRQVIISSRDPGLPPLDYLKHSGGIFKDMTIHDFDMARWLLGEEPVSVMAVASRVVESTLSELDDFDTLMVIMQTESGKQCHINCCREAVYGYDQRFEIFGSRGMLLNENLRPTTVRRYTSEQTESRQPLLNFFLERYADAYRAELEAFLTALRDGRPMPVTPKDGRQALKLADCAVESVRTGRMVKVD
ncbi:myo-inositol 2-dehydrogenase/D-chiro-inositol 1-dehydrogenase [Caballeronia udeis]|uniref:Myo-inositol 2-dehydrogenase/D-chiro-inositol 1-dehydrogenase n=1 Tax=Caballeronia udeis TaxID=1232866 RepID=A0ABW8MAE5_9BURK